MISELVGGIPTPLKNMSSSVGMMTFPILENRIHVPNHQPASCFHWIEGKIYRKRYGLKIVFQPPSNCLGFPVNFPLKQVGD